MSSQELLKGTAILTFSSIIARFIGLIFKILLARYIGSEGLGLLQMVMPIYSIAVVLASMGIPAAIAQKVARYHFIERIFYERALKRFALLVTFFCSLIISSCILFLLPLFAKYFPDQRIFLSLKIVPLALLFASPGAVLKGYFQGLKNMYPTAFSMLGEQVTRSTIGFIGAIIFLPLGLEYAIFGIVIGIIIGEAVSFSILAALLKKYQGEKLSVINKSASLRFTEKKDLLTLAIPLLFIRLSGSLNQAIESVLLPFRLQKAGFTSSQATSSYGELIGMAFPLLFLPTVLLIPFSISLLPQISSAVGASNYKQLRKTISFATWSTLLLGLVTAFILYFFAASLTSLIFSSPKTALLVRCLSYTAPFAFLQFVSATIVHGLGFPAKALQNDLIGTFISLLILYLLAARPNIGIFAAGPAYFAGFAVMTFLNYHFIQRYWQTK